MRVRSLYSPRTFIIGSGISALSILTALDGRPGASGPTTLSEVPEPLKGFVRAYDLGLN
jgi:hypothetical protein